MAHTTVRSSAFARAAADPAPQPGRLVLLRHGESEWNRDGRFTGWTDVDLTAVGMAEAARAGERLQREGVTFDACFTSVLRRASRTAAILLQAMQLEHIPVEQSWRLNERHYGALQGMGSLRAILRYGPLPVLRCKYRFTARPPVLAPEDPRFPGRDPRYADVRAEDLPCGESHADTLARLRPYWLERIAPELARGSSVLVVSHKNTLRALATLIEGRSESEVGSIRMPTGVPLVFAPDDVAPERWQRVRDR